jgi:hypothetical protein
MAAAIDLAYATSPYPDTGRAETDSVASMPVIVARTVSASCCIGGVSVDASGVFRRRTCVGSCGEDVEEGRVVRLSAL